MESSNAKPLSYNNLKLISIGVILSNAIYYGVIQFLISSEFETNRVISPEFAPYTSEIFWGAYLFYTFLSLAGYYILNKTFSKSTQNSPDKSSYYRKEFIKIVILNQMGVFGLLVYLLIGYIAPYHIIFFLTPVMFSIAFFPKEKPTHFGNPQ